MRVVKKDLENVETDPLHIYFSSIKVYLVELKRIAVEKSKSLEARERERKRSEYNSMWQRKESHDFYQYIENTECIWPFLNSSVIPSSTVRLLFFFFFVHFFISTQVCHLHLLGSQVLIQI
jgi:hypothetical protein